MFEKIIGAIMAQRKTQAPHKAIETIFLHIAAGMS